MHICAIRLVRLPSPRDEPLMPSNSHIDMMGTVCGALDESYVVTDLDSRNAGI
jgi:hypothetical protein